MGKLLPAILSMLILELSSIYAQTGWTVQTSGTTRELYTAKAVSQSIAWTAGEEGVVLRTTNGGSTWGSVGVNAPTGFVAAIEARDENFSLFSLVDHTGTEIYRTTNAGASWSSVFRQVGGFLDGIHMVDSSRGFALGDPVGGKWTILRTTDGGASWFRIPTEPLQIGGEIGWQNSFHVLDSSHIWFGTSAPRIYRSTDAGVTWTSSPTPIGQSWGVWFNDRLNGVAIDSTSAACRSTNGGATWISVSLGGNGSSYGISGTGVDFWVSRGTTVYHSSDRGLTWGLSFAGTVGFLRHVNFTQTGSSQSGWAVSTAGGIAGYTGTATAVRETRVEPTTFALLQNYPNPFNPTTNIRFEIPNSNHVTLKVFDVLGREVRTLVSEELKAGSYETTFDAISLASATYFYKLQAGEFVQTRKLTLLR